MKKESSLTFPDSIASLARVPVRSSPPVEKKVVKARWEILLDPELKKWLKKALIENGITASQFLENAIKMAQGASKDMPDDLPPSQHLINTLITNHLFKGENK